MLNVVLICLVTGGILLINVGVWAFIMNRLIKVERVLITLLRGSGDPDAVELLAELNTGKGGVHRG